MWLSSVSIELGFDNVFPFGIALYLSSTSRFRSDLDFVLAVDAGDRMELL